MYPAGKLWQLLLYAHHGLLTLCSTGSQEYAFTDSIERTSRAPTLYLQNNVDSPAHFILIRVKHYQCCFMSESCFSIPFLLFQQTDGSCYFPSLIFCNIWCCHQSIYAPTLYLQSNVDIGLLISFLFIVKHCFMCESWIGIPFLLFHQTDGSCYFLSPDLL